MITHIDISGVGKFQPNDAILKYVRKKIGALDRLAPRHARKTLRASVKIAQIDQPRGNKYQVEALLYVPGKTLSAKDSTMNAMAATDIIETKLANQLRKYKAETLPHVGNRRLLDRFKRSFAREIQVSNLD